MAARTASSAMHPVSTIPCRRKYACAEAGIRWKCVNRFVSLQYAACENSAACATGIAGSVNRNTSTQHWKQATAIRPMIHIRRIVTDIGRYFRVIWTTLFSCETSYQFIESAPFLLGLSCTDVLLIEKRSVHLGRFLGPFSPLYIKTNPIKGTGRKRIQNMAC